RHEVRLGRPPARWSCDCFSVGPHRTGLPSRVGGWRGNVFWRVLRAMRDFHDLPVFSIDPLDGGLERVRQCLDQRKLHDPMKSPGAMDLEGQEVVLEEAPIFGLVLGHDAEIGIMKPSSESDGKGMISRY